MTRPQRKEERPVAALIAPDILALLEESPNDVAAETEEMHAADLADVAEALPIEQVRVRILENKLASEDDLKKLDAQVRDIVNEAAEFATNDPEPDPTELWTDVYR